MLSTCKYTQMFCITFWLTLKQKVPEHFMWCTQHNRHDHLSTRMFCITSKQKVPEHSMQCAQRNRQDHLSLLMLECIMVLCVWLECWVLLLTYDTNVLYHRLGLWAPMYRGLGGWEREIHIIIIFFLLKKKKSYIFPTYTYPPPYT